MSWIKEVPRTDYRRWWRALSALPLALTIDARYGAAGSMHVETPNRSWSDALVLLEGGSHSASDIALPGFEEEKGSETGETPPRRRSAR